MKLGASAEGARSEFGQAPI